MATRTTSSSARSGSSGRTPSSRPSGGRGGSSGPRKPAPRGKPAAKPRGGGLPLPLRAVRGTWMGMAHVAGGTVRRIGTPARDLEPEHRRDGLGFALIALAIVVAAREWWGLQGVAGDVIHAVAAGTLRPGRVRRADRVLLLGLRLLRAPEDQASNNRDRHRRHGADLLRRGPRPPVRRASPRPPDGADAMRDAGGIIGFLASSPLAAAVSRSTAPCALLVLLGFFGLLVITATPVHMIPTRLRRGPRPAAAPRRVGPRRRRAGRVEAGADDTRRRPRRRGAAADGRGRARRRRGVRAGRRRRPGQGQPRCAPARSAPRRPGCSPPARPTEPAAEAAAAPAPPPGPPRRPRLRPCPSRPCSSRRPRRRCRSGSSSSPWPATSPTRCPTTPCSSRAARTRPAAPPTTASSSR